MMHVKAGIALLSDMVADLARVCALCCRVLAATPSRRLSAIVCGTKKERDNSHVMLKECPRSLSQTGILSVFFICANHSYLSRRCDRDDSGVIRLFSNQFRRVTKRE